MAAPTSRIRAPRPAGPDGPDRTRPHARGRLLVAVGLLTALLSVPGLPGSSPPAGSLEVPRSLDGPSLPSPTAGGALLAQAQASLVVAGHTFPSTPGWRLSAPPSHPSARFGASMTYDPALSAIVLFGGTDGTHYLNDTWEYAVGNSTTIGSWRTYPAVGAPSPRAFASVAFDAAAGALTLFGGIGSGGMDNQTWTLKGVTWTQQSPGTSPSPRRSAGMTFDSRNGQIILFGGQKGSTFYNDTWGFHAGTWTPLNVTRAPSVRAGSSFVFDPGLGADVLTGGVGPSGATPDTWELEGPRWVSDLSAGTAPGSWGAIATYDTADGILLIASGNVSSGASNATFEMTRDGNFSQPHLVAALPGRTGGTGAFDPPLGAVVVFGGLAGSALSDTWTFSLVGTQLGWETVNSTLEPSHRSQSAMAYDPADGEVVLFSGQSHSGIGDAPVTGSANVSGYPDDTWVFRHNQWTELFPSPAPAPRRGAMMAFDERDGYLVLFGGSNDTQYFNDTWTFKGGNWTLLHPSISPPARRNGGLTYDGTDAYLLLFGGHGGSTTNLSFVYFSDSWNFIAGAWKLLHPSNPPPAVAEPFFAYDPGAGVTLLFGGFTGTAGGSGENTLDTTYEYSHAAWTNLTPRFPSNHPSGRDGGAFVFDATTGSMVLWGGDNLSAILTDVWSFRNGTWSMDCLNCPPPGRGANHGVFDPSDGTLVAFATPLNNTGTGQTWINATWLSATPSASPPTTDLGVPSRFNVRIAGGVQPWTAVWRFDDGTNLTGYSVYHAWSTGGNHTARIVITDGMSNSSNVPIRVKINPRLQAAVLGLPWGPGVLTGRFNVTVKGGTAPFLYTYDYGDGNEATTKYSNSTYTYASAGNFTGSVTVLDAVGATFSGTANPLTLPAMVPQVNLTSNRTILAAPGTIAVVAHPTDPYGGLTYRWNVSPGIFPVHSSGAAAFVAIPQAGVANVTVTLTDASNFTVVSSALEITGLPPILTKINITAGIDLTCPVSAGRTPVVLYANTTGGQAPYNYTWNLSNGQILYGPRAWTNLTPSVPLHIVIQFYDAVGDNRSLSRDYTVPAATCSPAGLPSLSFLAALGVGSLALLVAAEAAYLIHQRRRARRSPKEPAAGSTPAAASAPASKGGGDPSEPPAPSGAPPPPG